LILEGIMVIYFVCFHVMSSQMWLYTTEAAMKSQGRCLQRD
jgi:hypothetical protein